MKNRLLLQNCNNSPLANVDVDIFWKNGELDNSHANKNGAAFFSGKGVISHLIIAGERIDIDLKVDGGCTVVAVSQCFQVIKSG